MTPGLIERHFDYVLGPDQDSRLASVASGAYIKEITLQLQADAPFCLRSRAVRQQYSATLTQANLAGLKTRWTGPTRDYRQQDYVPETLQMAYFGQCGLPKPIYPQVVYPANSILVLDLFNSGANAITNLTFFWRGVKLFQPGAFQAYTYPKRCKLRSYEYRIAVSNLGVAEFRQAQNFTVQPDADFVIRGGQCTAPFQLGSGGSARTFARVSIQLYDADKKPYSNARVPLDVLFGSANWPAAIPAGSTPSLVSAFGGGPGLPGLIYPEIYLPANQQLIYDLRREDGVANANQSESFTIGLIGAKVFPQ